MAISTRTRLKAGLATVAAFGILSGTALNASMVVKSGGQILDAAREVASPFAAVVGELGVEEAAASATGVSYFGNLGNIKGFPVYNGNYKVHLSGASTFVNHVEGSAVAASNLCNVSMTAEFFDHLGRWYMTRASGIRWGCGRSYQGWIPMQARVQAGRMCSTLKTNGGRITSVCHSIYP